MELEPFFLGMVINGMLSNEKIVDSLVKESEVTGKDFGGLLIEDAARIADKASRIFLEGTKVPIDTHTKQ